MLAVATDRPFCCFLFLRPENELVTLDLIQGYLYASADNQYDGLWFNNCCRRPRDAQALLPPDV